MGNQNKYLFGPVPSRRLGLSLGVDIVPFKVCTLDCVYCQIGRTTEETISRQAYVDIEAVLSELRQRIDDGVVADYITISGSGEPTLNIRLGELIDGIKKLTDIPVAVMTNGTLMYREDVRRDCCKADVVLPSLDAGSQEIFEKINRPYQGLKFDTILAGLVKFREQFRGQLWLEVFFIEDFNTDNKEISLIKRAIELIQPDKVQVNSAVRPTAESGIKKVCSEKLNIIAEQLGPNCEVVADFCSSDKVNPVEKGDNLVLSMLKRRPCSLEDVCSGLGISLDEGREYIHALEHQGFIHREEKDGITFFTAN